MTEREAIERARRLGFFPLVYLLERLAEGRPLTGEAEHVGEEAIRFVHDPSLGFSGDEVRAVRPLASPRLQREGPLFEVVCSFFGLTGAATPLPLHMAELTQYDGPEAARVRAFLAPFEHRLLSLLVRVRRRTDIPATGRGGGQDPWSRRLLDLVGAPDEGDDVLPSWLRLRLAPFLSTGRCSVAILEQSLTVALADLLGAATVSVVPLAGAWARLEEADRCRLGQASCQLGRTSVIGARMRDAGSRFRVTVGPLDEDGFAAFRPGELGHEGLRAVIRAVVRKPADYQLDLELAPAARPQLRLGAAGAAGLGRDSWLAGRLASQRVAFVCSAGTCTTTPLTEESVCA